MNNADSFAMAFDEAWKQGISNPEVQKMTQEKKIDLALSKIPDHPFLTNNPSEAREVAKFRIRLLSLK
tara:strand:+ start:277 stop:480 length:204 start_codon:yes stop_codon:yes gene_type:complete